MRVLVIDDKPDLAGVVVETIERDISDAKCESFQDFAAAERSIRERCPDAIVLDLIDDAQQNSLPGERTWQAVWNEGFCPIVIYTAFEGDLTPPVPPNHPFVKLVAKGAGSEARVIECLKGFAPGIAAIESLRTEVEKVIQRVFRDTAGAGVISADDPATLLHAGRRRLAAAMDEPTSAEKPLKSWEQYLLPPIGDSPLTADVLRRREAGWTSATDYRLVLTPSCDLVKDQNPSSILVAKCDDMTRLVSWMQLSLKEAKREESIKSLKSRALTQGVCGGWIPLPEFSGHIPYLAANLKDLEVLPFDEVCRADNTSKFERVASIDSPFREWVSWAFLTTIGRPGMPDRELDPWASAGLERAAVASTTGATTS